MGNTDGLSCCKKVKKKKKGHKLKQPVRALGAGEALMSCWRRISVFHDERCEGQGNVTANKINVQHKQAKRDEL